MKRIIVLMLITAMAFNLYAQDVIVKRDGTTILSKVVEINKNEIKYKKFSSGIKCLWMLIYKLFY